MKTIIVDSNVIAKIFVEEEDSQQAVNFFRSCLAKGFQVQAPDLLKYEIAQITLRKKLSMNEVMVFFEDHISVLVELTSPDHSVWQEAEKICQYGHIKSGFPTMYDSIYHAMAIINKGVFVTADRRHFEKAKSFGHICLLKGWEDFVEKP